jgi:hypothetical protein
LSKLRLRFLTGPRRGQQAAFTGPRVRIGRSRDNDVALGDSGAPQSSAHHAEAVVESGRWWIRDLESTNGTFVNGVRVSRARLRSGDSISFGEDHFAVETGRPFLVAAGVAALALAALVSIYAVFGRPVPDLQASAALVVRSVYLIAFDEPSGRRPLGTAFAVRADGLLATNAHVADAVRQRLAEPGSRGRAIAIRSDSDEVRGVVEIHMHPRWRAGSIADDAALLSVDGADPLVPLRLADEAAVARLSRGMALASLGFPAANVDATRPRGRLRMDVLGDIRDQRYLSVGLDIAPGTSGSPIFRADGVVVALVAGGEFVAGSGGGSTTTGVNWGISVAALHELLRHRS